MQSNTGIANREEDVDLCEAQVSAPVNTLAWLDFVWPENHSTPTSSRRHISKDIKKD